MNSINRRPFVFKKEFVTRCLPLFVVATSLTTTSPSFAENSLGQINRSIRNLWQQRTNHQSAAQQARQQASSYKNQAGALHQKLEKTQQLLLSANTVFENYQRQIKQTEARIVETTHRKQIVTERYNRHMALLGERLAAIQRTNPMGYMEVLLGARTFSDLSRRVYLFNAVLDRDADLQQKLKQDKQELITLENTLMSQWQQRNRLVQATQKEKSRIYLAQQELEGYWKQIKSSEYEQWAYAEASMQSSNEIGAMIGNLQQQKSALIAQYKARQAAAERARRAAQRKVRVAKRVTTYKTVPNNSGGSKRIASTRIVYEDRMVSDARGMGTLSEDFSESGAVRSSDGSWHMPVRARLSSRYGNRFHPILRRYKLHTGDDLAAGYGTPFKAAKSGTVLFAGWKTGYGNTVIIDNGNGMSTLYGHASKLAVSAGQQVQAGEYIGNVGSTGYSTGPHLHFEVRKNGRPVNPSPYLNKAGK